MTTLVCIVDKYVVMYRILNLNHKFWLHSKLLNAYHLGFRLKRSVLLVKRLLILLNYTKLNLQIIT